MASHTTLPRRLTLVLAVLITTVIGCRTDSAEQSFEKLFDGFQLKLVDSLPEDLSIQDIDSSILHNSFPTERRLTLGHVYVFKKMIEARNEELAIAILPQRLANIGARVTKAPRSSSDLMYLYIGGPLFMIEFEKNGHHGMVFNRSHISQTPGQTWEELRVVYK